MKPEAPKSKYRGQILKEIDLYAKGIWTLRPPNEVGGGACGGNASYKPKAPTGTAAAGIAVQNMKEGVEKKESLTVTPA